MLFVKEQNKTKIRKVRKNKKIRRSLQEAQYQNKRRFQTEIHVKDKLVHRHFLQLTNVSSQVEKVN